VKAAFNEAGATVTLKARLSSGTYYLVVRDANQLAATIQISVQQSAVVVPQPRPIPPVKPSFLLPPGKNGAPTHAIFTRSQAFSVRLPSVFSGPNNTMPSMRIGDGQETSTRECDGFIEEVEVNGTPRKLQFTAAAPCVDKNNIFYREGNPGDAPSGWKPGAPDYGFDSYFLTSMYNTGTDTYQHTWLSNMPQDLVIGATSATMKFDRRGGTMTGTPAQYAVTSHTQTYQVTFQY
jgi:hypothetical protein